ncbi:MAG: two-component system response regulator KdpE [Betaproteobacteria bacterium]
MSPRQVVLVEDEPHIRRFVRAALEEEHCAVFEADTAAKGLTEAGTRKPDLVIVDLGLPDRDGLELIRDLRGWSDVPVIVLSARSAESDKIAALDMGADDYLTKPFGVGELLARVRAAFRRSARGSDAGESTLRFGEVEIDLAKRVVRRAGADVHLTPIEYRLLAHMCANAGKVVTHRQILRDVWGPSHIEHTHYPRIFMQHLRQKLECDPARPVFLLTETGVGYRLLLA